MPTVRVCRTDWAKVSTDSDDSMDQPADATENALHNALTDMHRRGANVPSSSTSDTSGAGPEEDAVQGNVTPRFCTLHSIAQVLMASLYLSKVQVHGVTSSREANWVHQQQG